MQQVYHIYLLNIQSTTLDGIQASILLFIGI